ncbi:MAG: hypothetical protein JWQ87_3732 [Candidatus Sulfotelmatobacter sp.]|nr:hypothetical protein [Candidatus Sulfotelmatobacter sp.]
MAGVVEHVRNQAEINPRLLPAIDQLLVAAIKLGPHKKHEAINKILKLVPEWKRGDCWRRIRQLRRTSALATPKTIQDSKEPGNSVSCHRALSRPWLPEDDDKLLDWAGYEPVMKIAQRLGRSVRAVRFRLGALGMSARVKDGWSQRALRKLLRVSRTRLRHLVASGILRVRDPRITASSLAAWCKKNTSAADACAVCRPRTVIDEEGSYSWKRAAKFLAVTLGDVQNLISAGQLRLVDTFVTDRSFEEFCRKHGNETNLGLIDPATRGSLVSEYRVPETVDRKFVPRAQKHALVIRECRCGRKIAGNVYFRHVRHCRFLEGQAMRKAV